MVPLWANSIKILRQCHLLWLLLNGICLPFQSNIHRDHIDFLITLHVRQLQKSITIDRMDRRAVMFAKYKTDSTKNTVEHLHQQSLCVFVFVLACSLPVSDVHNYQSPQSISANNTRANITSKRFACVAMLHFIALSTLTTTMKHRLPIRKWKYDAHSIA